MSINDGVVYDPVFDRIFIKLATVLGMLEIFSALDMSASSFDVVLLLSNELDGGVASESLPDATVLGMLEIFSELDLSASSFDEVRQLSNELEGGVA